MTKKLIGVASGISFLLSVEVVYAQGTTSNEIVSPGPGFVNANNNNVSGVVSTVTQWLFIAATVLATVYLILGGIRWITSRGDKAGVEAARKQIVSAIIGLIVVAGAFLILNVVFGLLHVSNPLGPGGFSLPSLQP